MTRVQVHQVSHRGLSRPLPTDIPSLQISHWRGIREVLESNGIDVLITRVPATASIKDRAAILAESIAEKYPGQEVNLIGHSMVSCDDRMS